MNANFFRFKTDDKLILQGIAYRPENVDFNKAYLHIHGMAGNFYENRFLDFMAKKLTDAGYSFVSINTRGHDFYADFPIDGNEEKYKRIGDAYEIFDECVLDIKAAVGYLEGEGYKEIILCGHSLGAVKAAYYVAQTGDLRVKKLILMSPPDMISLAENENYHESLLDEAQKMITEGRGDELLLTKIWGEYNLSARTYVDLSSRDYPVDVFNVYDPDKKSLLENVGIPILAFFGEKDDAAVKPPFESLATLKNKAKKAPEFEMAVIDGASHSYHGKEKEMCEIISNWLKKN